MKVLIVSTSEQQGGAAIAAKRLMTALNEAGHEARMLVRDKQTDDEHVHRVRCSLWHKAWDHFRVLAANGFDSYGTWKLTLGISGVDITQHEDFLWADVINLHWVSQGFLSIASLRKIIRSGKHIVWTMHDQWALTGVCHLVLDCQQFSQGCNKACPQLKGRWPRRAFRLKQEMMKQGNVTMVGCSDWITLLAADSPLTMHQRLESIPNVVPQQIFRPIPKKEARRALGLPEDMHYIMVAACRLSDTLKGFEYVQRTARLIGPSEHMAFIIVGRGQKLEAHVPVYDYPYVEDQQQMALLYSAASVYVSCSLTENLPNTVAEAMSCGTPCCAFDVGGLSQMIDDRVNGYLVKLYDVAGMLTAIRRAVNSLAGSEALRTAQRDFSAENVLSRYLKVYQPENPWEIPDETRQIRKVEVNPYWPEPIVFREPQCGKTHLQRQHHMPIFTVCTVCRNAEATIQATLRSVAAQSYALIEHLIIDGCSTDGTMALLKAYEDENIYQRVPHHIRIISEPDSGLYDAMNKGIKRADGQYIIFLNAGDRLHDSEQLSQISRQVGLFPIELPAVIYGETDLVDADGKFLRHRRLRAPQDLKWTDFSRGMLVCHQSFYVRTDIARQESYFLSYRFSSDFDWCIRIMRRCAAQFRVLHNSHLILTDYLSDGLTTKNHRRSLLERFQIMTLHYGWLRTIAMHLWFIPRAMIMR